MNERIEACATLAKRCEQELLVLAVEQLLAARRTLDPDEAQRLSESAATLRRVVEFAGAIGREMEDEREAQRPLTRREMEYRGVLPLNASAIPRMFDFGRR